MNLRKGNGERGEGPSMTLSPRSRFRLFMAAEVPAISQDFSATPGGNPATGDPLDEHNNTRSHRLNGGTRMAKYLIIAPGLSKDDPTNTKVNGTLEFAMRLAESEDIEFGPGHQVVEVPTDDFHPEGVYV